MIARQRIAYHLDCPRESTASGCQQNFPWLDIFASLERVEFGRKGRAPDVRRDDRLD